ncbi:MAG: hypothetical protein K6E10_01305 [Eubacterium sp.]|nr:hypothetical protein [Eubacterium sp.]
MKEFDENIININESKSKKNTGIMARYNNLNNIPARIRFLVDMKKYLIAKEASGDKVTDLEIKESQDIIDSFTHNYITNGSPDLRKMIFTTLGRITAENNYDCYREYNRQLNTLPEKTNNLKMAATWMMDQTEVGMESLAINNISNNLFNAMPANNDFKNWAETGAENYYAQNNLDDDILETTKSLPNRIGKDDLYKDINNWINKTGSTKSNRRKKTEAKRFKSIFKERYDENKKYPDLKSDQMVRNIRRKYLSLNTMEEKMDFIIETYTQDHARNLIYGSSNSCSDFLYDILADFTDIYVINANKESAEKAFRYIGKKTFDNTLSLMEIDNSYRTEFNKEEKKGIKKADILSWKTIPGAKAQLLRQITQYMTNKFSEKSKIANELWENSGLNSNSTIEDYLTKTGMTKDEISEYLMVNKANPKDKATKVLWPAVEFNEVEANIELQNRFVKDISFLWLEKDNKNSINNMDKDNKDLYIDITNKINTEISESGIDKWLANEGNVKSKLIEESTAAQINNMSSKIDNKVKSYDNYIKLHTGYDVVMSNKEKKQDYLIKAIAANALKKGGEKFSIDKIHKLAEALKDSDTLNKLTYPNEEVNKALSSPENIEACSAHIYGRPYEVITDKISDYISDMNKLSKNMMSSKDRSDKYKAVTNAVKAIADLKNKYDFSLDTDKKEALSELKGLSHNLHIASQIYMADKEKVRTSSGGKERFNNTLDAVAIMSKYIPKASNNLNKLVTSINKTRKAASGSKNYVDLKNYGANRAEQAKKRREPAKKNINKENAANIQIKNK